MICIYMTFSFPQNEFYTFVEDRFQLVGRGEDRASRVMEEAIKEIIRQFEAIELFQ